MKKRLLPLIFCVGAICTMHAQPGLSDPTFDPGTGTNNEVLASAVGSDGKIYIGGLFTNVNGSNAGRFYRLNANGTQDVPVASFQNDVNTVLVQPDGKILIGGAFPTANIGGIVAASRIVRVNTDGTADNTFVTNIGVGADNAVKDIALQSDGKIIVGGFFNNFAGQASYKLIRLNANGAPDYTMIVNGTSVNTLAVQTDNKILVGGQFTQVGGQSCPNFTRLNSDMTDDAAFRANLGTGFNGVVHDIVVQSDGKIIVVGDFTMLNGAGATRIVRLNSDGTRDNTFLAIGFNNIVYCAAITQEGQILVGGQFTDTYGVSFTAQYLVMLNSDGTADQTFTTNAAPDAKVRTLTVQPDGQIIAGGQFSFIGQSSRVGIARLNPGCGANSSSSITVSGCGSYIAPDGNSYFQSGNYSAVIPNAAGCDSIISIALTILPLQQQTIDNNGGELILVSGNVGTAYQWVICGSTDTPIPGATNATYTPTATGSYAVLVTLPNGCDVLSNCENVTVSTSSLSEESTKGLDVFPNPTTNSLTIRMLQPGKVLVESVNGTRLSEVSIADQTTIDVSSFAPGVYFIRTSEGQTVKFIKE